MATPPPARRARGSLDVDRILDAAYALAAEVGLAKLAMPELAGRLDVGVTSIYWHIGNKDQLLRLMAARAVVQLDRLLPRPVPEEPRSWRAQLRAYFTREREVLAADELLTDLTAGRNALHGQESIDIGYRGVEAMMRLLVAAGFSAADAWGLYASLSHYTQGLAVAERRRRTTGFPPEGLRQLGLLDAAATPLVVGLVQDEGISIDLTGDAVFRFGLEALLDGAERRLAPAPEG